jgi:hypothetical protein
VLSKSYFARWFKRFHFLHMSPISDVTMSKRLCVADFGHVMPYGTVAGQKFGRFQPEPSQKPMLFVCDQHTKENTAGLFHFLHMSPMSDVTMLQSLCVADFGHVMPSWHCSWPKVLADCSHSQAKNQCRLFAGSTPRKPLLDQFISSYGSNE